MKTKKLTFYSLLLAISLILGFVETLIPNPYPIPGVKLGLTNIISVFSIFNLNFFTALIITILRIFLSGFLFGSFSSILYSLVGGLGSLVIMLLFYKLKFSIIPTSIAGGITHNLFQLTVACMVVNNWNLFITYCFPLFISGILTGLFIGLITLEFNKAFYAIKKRSRLRDL